MIISIMVGAVCLVGIIMLMSRSMTRFSMTKRFVRKELKAVWPEETFEETDIELTEIGLSEIADRKNAQDKIVYHVRARNSAGEVRNLEIRSFDPAAEFEDEEYREISKSSRPKDEGMNAVSGDAGSLGGNHVAGIEQAQGMLRDQAKLEREERIINARYERIKLDVEITKLLSEHSAMMPKIHHYNERKACAVTDFTGEHSLVRALQTMDSTQKTAVYRQLVSDLAAVQSHFGSVSLFLPARPAMDVNDYRNALAKGFGELKKAGLLSDAQISEIQNEYYPIAEFLAGRYKANIYFAGFSPYNFYMNEGTAMMRDWSNYDSGQMWVNLIELLKDPVSDLSAAEEEELVRLFAEGLENGPAETEALKLYHLSSCHLLTVQLCYMKVYLQRVAEMPEADQRVLLNWDQAHFDALLGQALAAWSGYEESRAYAALLQGIFEAI